MRYTRFAPLVCCQKYLLEISESLELHCVHKVYRVLIQTNMTLFWSPLAPLTRLFPRIGSYVDRIVNDFAVVKVGMVVKSLNDRHWKGKKTE